MSFDSEDPKWSAYVLGELDDDARARIDGELAQSPEAQRFVEELRRTIDLLSTELHAEPCPSMAGGERVPVDQAAGELVAGSDELIPIGVDDSVAGDIEADGNTKLFRTIRPEGHSRFAVRRAILALAASLVAAACMISYLLSPGAWHIRDLKLARKSDSQQAVHQWSADGEQELDGTSPLAAQADPNASFDYYQTDNVEYMPQGAELSTDTLSLDTPTITAEQDPYASPKGLDLAPGSNYPSGGYAASAEMLGGMGGGMGGSGGRGEGLSSRASGASRAVRGDARGRDQAFGGRRIRTNNGHFLSPAPESLAADPRSARGTYGGEAEDDRKQYGYGGGTPLAEEAAASEVAEERAPVAYPNSNAWRELEKRRMKFSEQNTEAYEAVIDNPFRTVAENPLSTFSIDVDTASYSIVRRYLQQNHQLPPRSAVRIEELVNYFHYDYPQPEGDKPFAANVEVAGCPWNAEHRLVRIGIKGREVARDQRPLTNLVFLIDVSGSMQSPDKLPLVKESMRLLAEQMGENDRVAIVVYAGSTGLALPSTSGTDKQTILKALDALAAGGSTNGGQGIQLAYDIAVANFVKGGVNRVILATDGDFNVGVTDRGELVKLIEQKAASGVFLTTLGYGMGNLKDATLEQLADKGNGNYAYIDNIREAKKVLVEQMSGTLVTIAKDVKIQIEFNPTQVAAFRLIGYENRILRHEDFNNDKKDAGEIGAGHTVTALYELVPRVKGPAAAPVEAPAAVDPLKYQQKLAPTDAAQTAELLTLKLRYKQPDGDKSQLLEYPVKDSAIAYARATGDFKFAASVALFGMLLRESPYRGTASFAAAHELAQEGRGSDEAGYRGEFIELIQAARALQPGG